MGKRNHLLLAVCSLFAVVSEVGDVGSAAPSALHPVGFAFKPWTGLIYRCLPNGTAAEQMLNLVEVSVSSQSECSQLQEELCVV